MKTVIGNHITYFIDFSPKLRNIQIGLQMNKKNFNIYVTSLNVFANKFPTF